MPLGQNGNDQIKVFALDLHSLYMMLNSSAEGAQTSRAAATETVRANLFEWRTASRQRKGRFLSSFQKAKKVEGRGAKQAER